MSSSEGVKLKFNFQESWFKVEGSSKQIFSTIFQIYIFIFVLVIASYKSTLDRSTQSSLFHENKNGAISNAYSEILSEEEKTSLSKKLYDYEIAATNQIVLVSIDAMTPWIYI